MRRLQHITFTGIKHDIFLVAENRTGEIIACPVLEYSTVNPLFFVGNKWSTKLHQAAFFDQRKFKNNQRNPHYNAVCQMLPQSAKR